jgi:glycosyltransferase involved in cell wall biosynthesis
VIAVLFGTYNAAHAANVLLAGDLERAGLEVRSCHEPLWEDTRDKHAAYFAPLALLRLGLRWLGAAGRLARRFRAARPAPDLVVAGFNGQLDVVLARLIAPRRPLLFAPLVTITETLVDDRATYRAGSLAARLLTLLDRVALGLADRIVIDTAAHRDYLCERLAVPGERVTVQYLGAEDAFAPLGPSRDQAGPTGREPAQVAERPAAEPSAERSLRVEGGRRPPVRVLFYCTYVPLHGAGVVARAMGLLSPADGIEVAMIGTGPERADCEALVRGLPHVAMRDWIPYEELPARIREADLVLGIFGSSVKARMVVPNKVYQAAQVGRAIVTADTPAIREVFHPRESIWTIPPDPVALADALRHLSRDEGLRARLGREARAAVLRAAGPAVRAARLAEIGRELRRPGARAA